MKIPSVPTLIEDNSGNKYYFYYTDSSIYLKEITDVGVTKDTLLINQVSENFLVTVDESHNFYLVCYSKFKGIVTLVHSGDSWRLLDAPVTKHVTNAILLDTFVINGSVHIIYATPLPLVNFYNLHHLCNHDEAWTKEALLEIHTENIKDTYAGTVSSNGNIHFACLRYDGKEYYINFSTYDNESRQWQHSNIVNLFDRNINIALLNNNDAMVLLVYTSEEDSFIVFTFEKPDPAALGFDFISLNRMGGIPEDAIIAFNLKEAIPYYETVYEKCYYRFIFDHDQKDWCLKKRKDLYNDIPVICVNHIMQTDTGYTVNSLLCTYSEDSVYPIPLYLLEVEAPAAEQPNEVKSENEEIFKVTNMDEFIPFLVEQIKTLSENIKIINSKLNETEAANAKKYTTSESIAPRSADNIKPKVRNSSFKDNFMNSQTSFSGFKQSSQGKFQNNTASNNSIEKTNTSNSSFRENFINNESIKNNYSTSAVFYGKKMGNLNVDNTLPPSNAKYAMSSFNASQNGNSFMAYNEGTEPETAIINSKDKTAESQNDNNDNNEPISKVEQNDQKKPNNILKIIGDFFK